MLSDVSWTAFPATEIEFRVSPPSAVAAEVYPLPTGSLPAPTQFAADKGTKWTITYVGDLQFTGKLGEEKLEGDKCRSSKLDDRVFWNCEDMECGRDWTICSFNMGPAFYDTDSAMTVNTTGVNNVQHNNFISPWSGDPAPEAPQTAWGMGTINVAAINDTHGVAYAWEIWRGASDGSYVDRGNSVVAVTLGETKPITMHMGPLVTGPAAIQMGLLAILRADNYVYTYSTLR